MGHMYRYDGRRDADIVLLTLVGAAFAACLLFYYLHLPALGALALALFIATPFALLMDAQSRREVALASVTVILALILRIHISDFSLFVGDASAYTWDAVLSVEEGVDKGFFLPLSSAIAAVGYEWFGLEFVSLGNVLVSILSAYLIFRAAVRLTSSRAFSFAAAALVALHPLPVWFSKTTFSETAWQCIVLACLLAVQQLRDQLRFGIGVLALLLAVSNFSRGTAPFLFVLILIGVLFLETVPLRQRITASMVLSGVFLASLAMALFLREPYLIGWQYSRVIHSITSLSVLAIVAAVSAAAILLIPLLLKFVGRLPTTITLLIGLLGVKIASSVVLSNFDAERAVNLLFRNEASLATANFGVHGTVLAIIGLVILVRESARGRIGPLIILAGYCLSSVPFSLADVSATRPHEMTFYWSRYFYSDLFIYYVLAMAVGTCALANQLLRYMKAHAGGAKAVVHSGGVVLLLLVIDSTVLAYAAKTAYLDGSSQVMQFIRDMTKGRDAVILVNSKVRYGPYGPELLLRSIRYLAPSVVDVRSVHDAVDTHLGSSPLRVICINLEGCGSKGQLTYVADFTRLISWDAQRSGYLDIVHKQFIWSLTAYDYCPPLSYGMTRVNAANRTCLNSSGVLASGWHSVEAKHVWSSEAAVLRLQLPGECIDGRCVAQLALSAFAASSGRPVTAVVESSIATISHVFTDTATHQIEIALPAANEAQIGLRVDKAKSPAGLKLSSDARVLGLALYRYSIRSADEANGRVLD